jgi:hypothetical protein
MNTRPRNVYITIFVIVWTIVFHYESIRYFYLDPILIKHTGQPLPKFKFLFPPAGWIMFFNVNDASGFVEVYGIKDKVPQLIDPHLILQTRTFGYDNIHRNILGQVAASSQKKSFCGFLDRKFSYYDDFLVVYIYYPSLTQEPQGILKNVIYRCEEK